MIGRLLSWWRARRDRRLGLLGSDPSVALVRRNHARSQRENATGELADIADQVNALIRENEEHTRHLEILTENANETYRARLDGPCVSCGNSKPYPGACPSSRSGDHLYAPRGTEWAGRQGKEP